MTPPPSRSSRSRSRAACAGEGRGPSPAPAATGDPIGTGELIGKLSSGIVTCSRAQNGLAQGAAKLLGDRAGERAGERPAERPERAEEGEGTPWLLLPLPGLDRRGEEACDAEAEAAEDDEACRSGDVCCGQRGDSVSGIVDRLRGDSPAPDADEATTMLPAGLEMPMLSCSGAIRGPDSGRSCEAVEVGE